MIEKITSTAFLKSAALVLLLVVISLVSITKITPWAVSPATHEHSVAAIDNKVTTVMELTAGATAASAVLSFIPDDTCTPIANELAELGKYFLVVLSALYLEKYLVTAVGYLVFSVMIPIVCICFGVGILAKKNVMNILAVKILIAAVVLFIAVPFSVKVSDVIYQNYEDSINQTIEEAVDISGSQDDNEGIVSQITNWLKENSQKAIDYVSNILSNFIEALAVMIVTSCLVPILVLVFIFWLVKLLMGPGPKT